VNVRAIAIGLSLAALAVPLAGGVALARNPHCAGGIQYVVGGLRDKDKGNTEDYLRQMNKAVAQLSACAQEDPDDFEALGYLGWAYAEIDSAGPAGQAFQKAIDGLTSKGDKKKAEMAANNRDHYWADALNDGIAKINAAQAAYPDYTRKPENEADETLRTEAGKRYQEALASLIRASLLRPGHPQTMRNLGSVYAFQGEYLKAEAVFKEGLKLTPQDSSLVSALHSVRVNYANQLNDEKRYGEAISYFQELIKLEPGNSDLYLGLGSACFSRAQADTGAARQADFMLAGEAYQKAGELKPTDADLPFNAALGYQNAGDNVRAEAQWQASLKIRPDDPDASSGLAGTLADLGRFDEAVRVLHKAVAADPKNKKLHRQLGGVFSKANNNAKATEELMMYLALQNGGPAPDPSALAKKAPAGSDAAKTLAAAGVPEQVNPWQAQGESYESWFYWSKQQAYHFKGGSLAVKSDWGQVGGAGSGTKKP
jgi:tetratricopeptide (TPR) repeat protein